MAAKKSIRYNKDIPITTNDSVISNNIQWCEANVIKYTPRHTRKNGSEDIHKAIWFLKKILRAIQLQYLYTQLSKAEYCKQKGISDVSLYKLIDGRFEGTPSIKEYKNERHIRKILEWARAL